MKHLYIAQIQILADAAEYRGYRKTDPASDESLFEAIKSEMISHFADLNVKITLSNAFEDLSNAPKEP